MARCCLLARCAHRWANVHFFFFHGRCSATSPFTTDVIMLAACHATEP